MFQPAVLSVLVHAVILLVFVPGLVQAIGGGKGGAMELQPNLISECSIGF